MATELTTLEHERESIEAQLTRLEQFFDNFKQSNSVDINQLNARFSRGKKLLSQFEAIHTKIERIDQGRNQRIFHSNFEDHYFAVIPAIEIFLKNKTEEHAHINSVTTTNAIDSQTCNVRLPTINLPTFDGAYEEWLSFYETFTSLIHDNHSLPVIQKFHYLRASLKGEAARVLRSLEVSAVNYEVALSILKQRFENRRLITQHHVKALFELKPIVKESASHIRCLSDKVHTHLRALEALKQPVNQWDTMLIYLITNKLDSSTKREWETKIAAVDTPSMNDLSSFLLTRCQLLESLNVERPQPIVQTPGKTRCHLTAQKVVCPHCQQTHAIYRCEAFLALTVPERIKEVQKHKLCMNCLKPGHFAKKCPGGSCRQCGQQHNTCLHYKNEVTKSEREAKNTGASESTSVSTHCAQLTSKQVLLSTAIIYVYDHHGQRQNCRVLLDSGSQSHFISEKMCQRLKLKREPTNVPISGISNTTVSVRDRVAVKIQARKNPFQTAVDCLVLPRITDHIPTAPIDRKAFHVPSNIVLADPEFHVPGEIDMLLGAGIFWNLICVGQIITSRDQPVLQKTKLGWILSGAVTTHEEKGSRKFCNLAIGRLEEQVRKFWEIEDAFSNKPMQSNEEILCEKHFAQHTTRGSDGKFMVRLPLKEPREILNDSRAGAIKRFYQLERKLEQNLELKTQYHQFMGEYLKFNHMEEVPAAEVTGKTFYLPHHAVFKDSLTTKLRVVFDASAKAENKVSLNDIMLVGPTIQQDLVSIVLRFRTHKYVMTADIAKMYRQIWIHPDDRNLQMILWRTSTTEPIKAYRLNTVTYGTAAASFLATRCLHEVARLEGDREPALREIIRNDFYMDDLLTGADTLEDALMIRQKTQGILRRYGFELRKWCANHTQLLQTEQGDDVVDMMVVPISENSHIKALGLCWEPISDVLRYILKTNIAKERITKRTILSLIAQIFDPLGLLGPILVIAKIILQQLWQEKIDWDSSLPGHLHTAWEQYRAQLESVVNLRIPRAVINIEKPVQLEIHGFSDASEAAYGAAIYVRATNAEGAVHCQLLCSRTRVAPLKQLSLPRLELCGARLLTELYVKVKDAINKEHNVWLWTDSTIVLAWLSSPSQKWQTFVANRVSQIQNIVSSERWCHINTRENPADLLTRGVTTAALMNNSLWWAGPEWLSKPTTFWPTAVIEKVQAPEEKIKKPITLIVNQPASCPQLCERFSTLTRLQRTTAYCLRFANNCKKLKANREVGTLSVIELRNALLAHVRLMQEASFSREINQLRQGQGIATNSSLCSLNPFSDTIGLLRVGGRLSNVALDEDKKHPLILPSSHHLTKLIVQHAHKQELHAGIQTTLAAIRLQYWPLNGRSTIRKYIKNCVPCFKQRPTQIMPQMGQLPAARATPAPPFHQVGVDYAGPIYLKPNTKNSKTSLKGYIAVFVCLASKAIHLEAVSALTTDAFLSAFRRFCGRRGVPSQVHSDNGTNFVGAERELKELTTILRSELFEKGVIDHIATKGIQWHFIPPQAPHFGGLWEAGVKAVKHHLRRMVGNSKLTFEEINTLLIQIEAVLNSRPLCALTEDPNDLAPLTPAHFRIGRPLVAVPDANYNNVPINRLSRWQHIQRLNQQFWRRWSREYLPQLQARSKWKQSSAPPLQIGNLVLLKSDHLPPASWQLGRVRSLHPGPDGIIRVASIKTSNGEVKRCVAKVYVLPMESTV